MTDGLSDFTSRIRNAYAAKQLQTTIFITDGESARGSITN